MPEQASTTSTAALATEKRRIQPHDAFQRRQRRRSRRSLFSITALTCVSPFWAAAVALALAASRRIDPGDTTRYLHLPPAHTSITITFTVAVLELFAFVGSMVAYGVNKAEKAYRRRLTFFTMGAVTFEAIASSAWVVCRAVSLQQSGICAGSLTDEVEECQAGLDLILAMGAVRFGYVPFVLAAALLYPGPWTKDDTIHAIG